MNSVHGSKIKAVMVWLMPLILIGGFFWPALGYLVFLMMLFFLPLSYFRGRFWCANLCPRGAFLDLGLSRVSRRRKIPAVFHRPWFRWAVFAVFVIFFINQLVFAEKTFYAIGFVFVRMCLITTLVAIALGIPIHQRMWCMFCPMGTLQAKIHSFRKERSA